ALLSGDDTGMQSVGKLVSASLSIALGMNQTDQVRRMSRDAAFSWSRETGMHDLNSLISGTPDFVLTHAAAINTRGQILALGRDNHHPASHLEHFSLRRVFLLTPVAAPHP